MMDFSVDRLQLQQAADYWAMMLDTALKRIEELERENVAQYREIDRLNAIIARLEVT